MAEDEKQRILLSADGAILFFEDGRSKIVIDRQAIGHLLGQFVATVDRQLARGEKNVVVSLVLPILMQGDNRTVVPDGGLVALPLTLQRDAAIPQ